MQRNQSLSAPCLVLFAYNHGYNAKVMKTKSAIKGHIMGFALQWSGIVYRGVSQLVITSLLQFISD